MVSDKVWLERGLQIHATTGNKMKKKFICDLIVNQVCEGRPLSHAQKGLLSQWWKHHIKKLAPPDFIQELMAEQD